MDNPATSQPPNRPPRPLVLAPRLYPSRLQLAGLYHNPHKKDFVDHRFAACNFSFVLRGEGIYRAGDRQWPVAAPCVFIQKPGVDYWYGPQDEWEECSLIYPQEAAPELAARGYLEEGRDPIWPITNLPRLQPLIEELLELRSSHELITQADRADRLADLLIFESLQQRPPPRLSPAQERVATLRRRIEADPAAPGDVAGWARACGLSESSFRRAWAALCDRSPADYHQHLRLQEACRLLINSSLGIGEIAQNVGFDDPLYFSRIFRRKLRLTPTQYRQRQRNLTKAFRQEPHS